MNSCDARDILRPALVDKLPTVALAISELRFVGHLRFGFYDNSTIMSRRGRLRRTRGVQPIQRNKLTDLINILPSRIYSVRALIIGVVLAPRREV